jgi:hypothetical protein
MYGYASLTLDRRSSTLSVPVQAIAHGSRTSVLVIDQTGRTEEREVRMGLETPNAVEILSGLREGELVMIGNRSGIKTGTRVEPRIARASEFEGGE